MVANMHAALVLLLVVAAVFIFKAIFRSFTNNLPSLPPGPKGLPLVGNVLDMPSEKEWLTFARWGDSYGMSTISRTGSSLFLKILLSKAISVLLPSWDRPSLFSILRDWLSTC